MDKILNYPSALLNQVRRLALEAGDATLEFFDEAGFQNEIIDKDDGSPVTIADQTAHDIIMKGLKEITPSVSIISEEGQHDTGLCPDYFWLVDPLDGTKGFIKGDKDYTVNIGLIHQGVPILGVVYAPAIGELYAGGIGLGAIKYNDDTKAEKEIRVRKILREGLTVFVSHYEGATPKRDEFISQFKIEKLVKRSSSIKQCLVAAGKGDLSFRFQFIYEWDLAAVDAIMRGAGGVITDWDNKPLAYHGLRGDLTFKGFLAHAGEMDFISIFKEIEGMIGKP